MSDTRSRAEEALDRWSSPMSEEDRQEWGDLSDELVGRICGLASALRALLAEPDPPCGSTSTVRSDDPPAQPLPTCVNCGSNFITPSPSSAVREAAERLRSTRDFDPFDETGRLGPDADALLAALAARGGA